MTREFGQQIAETVELAAQGRAAREAWEAYDLHRDVVRLGVELDAAFGIVRVGGVGKPRGVRP